MCSQTDEGELEDAMAFDRVVVGIPTSLDGSDGFEHFGVGKLAAVAKVRCLCIGLLDVSGESFNLRRRI